ncbi:hypothetical protein DXG03_004542 [Asterophora parasitica]|uniref:Transcriptional coactivator p15 (PC4) C-terminal domain-containing protein n=1 Tax=Asterophora parasitica TaxID=117018 RepID=A0A9P7G0Z3_9AGAR|nr:hypothetical protein DXG03_004542 [Asterophora parasitica]
MAKRKASGDDGDNGSDHAGFPAEQPKSKRAQNKVKKEGSDSDYALVKAESCDEEDEHPLSKKPKAEKEDKTKAKDASSSTDLVKITPEGDKYIELGKKKRATVRSFKGTPLVDIREFYGADGEEKPGKKGISLTLDQVRVVLRSVVFDAMKLIIAGLRTVGDIEGQYSNPRWPICECE